MSGLYSVDRLAMNGALPQELVNYVTQAEWTSIAIAINEVNGNVQTGAFLVEAGVCFFTCFFCVFCAHPCIANAFADTSVPQKIVPLNSALFHGQPVIGYMNQRVTINTALLAQIKQNNVVISPAHVEYVMATATPMAAAAHVEPIHAHASAPPLQSAEVYNKPV